MKKVKWGCGILPDMKSNSLIKISPREEVRLRPLGKVAPMPKGVKSRLAFPKKFKAGVLVDKHRVPRYFIFDAHSLWDLFCVFDEIYEKIASHKDYLHRNPFGWMIDSVEVFLPLNPRFVRTIKKRIQSAERLGTVPFSKIKRRLGLA